MKQFLILDRCSQITFFPLTEFTQFREIERHFNRENAKIPLWDWSYKLGLTKQDFVPRTRAFHKEKALFLYFDSLKNQTSLSEEIISCHCAESLRAILQQKNFRDSHSIAVFTGELHSNGRICCSVFWSCPFLYVANNWKWYTFN